MNHIQTNRLPVWRGLHQNEIDLAKALRSVMTTTDLPDLRAATRTAAALSARHGDVIGELTRGLLRATLRANNSPAAIAVLGELQANTNDVVDQAIANYLRWANRVMWDNDAAINTIINRKTGRQEDNDDDPVLVE
jgi:hypothetical protein